MDEERLAVFESFDTSPSAKTLLKKIRDMPPRWRGVDSDGNSFTNIPVRRYTSPPVNKIRNFLFVIEVPHVAGSIACLEQVCGYLQPVL